MRTIGVSFIAILFAMVGGPWQAAAQVRADPGVVIGDRIAVRVNVTLEDDDTPYYPVRGLALAFAGKGADTVVGRTDEAGVVTVLLRPGDYVVSSVRPFAWKGTSYGWSVPFAARADMRAIDLSRANARVGGASRIATSGRSVQSTGDVAPRTGTGGGAAGAAGTGTSSGGAIRWLSIEVGGEGGLTRLGVGTGSDASYGGAGSFVAGIGPVALAVGYRYTRLSLGGDLDPGNLSGATAELRYHLRPGAAPIRPYIGVVAGAGQWEARDVLADKPDMRMVGGTVGAQFGLATSVRLHVAATAAGTNIKTSPTSNGMFTMGTIGLTFDIFSPAR